MKPTTLKERFNEKFGYINSALLPLHLGRTDEILAFFHQELMALADSAERQSLSSSEIIRFIRSKASELIS